MPPKMSAEEIEKMLADMSFMLANIYAGPTFTFDELKFTPKGGPVAVTPTRKKLVDKGGYYAVEEA